MNNKLYKATTEILTDLRTMDRVDRGKPLFIEVCKNILDIEHECKVLKRKWGIPSLEDLEAAIKVDHDSIES